VKRRPAPAGELPAIPAPLCRFDDWTVEGPTSAGDYLAEHGRWLEARRAWEVTAGVTIASIVEELHRRALAVGTLEALCDPYGELGFIDDDEPDPRWLM
jgi:hypothetical protein